MGSLFAVPVLFLVVIAGSAMAEGGPSSACDEARDPDTLIFEGGPVDEVAEHRSDAAADRCAQVDGAAGSTVTDTEALIRDASAQDPGSFLCWLAPGMSGC